MPPTIRIPLLHFNDVYRIRQNNVKPPSGKGAAGVLSADQFAAKIQSLREAWFPSSSADSIPGEADAAPEAAPAEDPDAARDWASHQGVVRRGLTLFSGDVFSPSVESSVTRGEHMVPIMNHMQISASVCGNHDYDFGYPHFRRLAGKTNFPWVFSNVADVSSAPEGTEEGALASETPQEFDQQPQGTLPFWTTDVQGQDSEEKVKIGVIGLIEKDWIKTVPSFPSHFRYRSMALAGRRLSKLLREQHGCHLVFALTHARLQNDIDLANDLDCLSHAGRNGKPPAEGHIGEQSPAKVFHCDELTSPFRLRQTFALVDTTIRTTLARAPIRTREMHSSGHLARRRTSTRW